MRITYKYVIVSFLQVNYVLISVCVHHFETALLEHGLVSDGGWFDFDLLLKLSAINILQCKRSFRLLFRRKHYCV